MRIESDEYRHGQVLGNQQAKVEPWCDHEPELGSLLPADKDKDVNDHKLHELHHRVEF